MWPLICVFFASMSIFGHRSKNTQIKCVPMNDIEKLLFPTESWGEEDLTRGQGTYRCQKQTCNFSFWSLVGDCANADDQATCTSWRLLKRTAAGSSSPSHRFKIRRFFIWLYLIFTDWREDRPVLSDTAWLEAGHCPRQLFCQSRSILQVGFWQQKVSRYWLFCFVKGT